jgi:hypothetical protein
MKILETNAQVIPDALAQVTLWSRFVYADYGITGSIDDVVYNQLEGALYIKTTDGLWIARNFWDAPEVERLNPTA